MSQRVPAKRPDNMVSSRAVAYDPGERLTETRSRRATI
jgi:hypothetical protein